MGLKSHQPFQARDTPLRCDHLFLNSTFDSLKPFIRPSSRGRPGRGFKPKSVGELVGTRVADIGGTTGRLDARDARDAATNVARNATVLPVTSAFVWATTQTPRPTSPGISLPS
jgi:hypothetical protein